MVELGQKVKAWINGVPIEPEAQRQIMDAASLQAVHPYAALMPDAHVGKGCVVGAVIPTRRAVIPAAVGVDIGCGVCAIKTTLTQKDLPESLQGLFVALESLIPVGFDNWATIPRRVEQAFHPLMKTYHAITNKHPKVDGATLINQLGTLGGGNHFVEISVDTDDDHLWVMLHSGSRGPGHRIGQYFITKAFETFNARAVKPEELPNRDLAYLIEGEPLFKDYMQAVSWAQDFASTNRRMILDSVMLALGRVMPPFKPIGIAVNCHHNYVEKEKHFGEDLWITRKGAIRAAKDQLGVIPGTMGTASFIVRGLGNPASFQSASHGAGRVMSRSEARDTITVGQHQKDTDGVVCRKDDKVVDESPRAYKDIRAVMEAQKDLVEVVAELHPLLVLKG